MPRMQVYLTEELHRRVKDEHLPVSEILQEALRHELSSREKRAALDAYLNDLASEVGDPTADDHAFVERLMAQINDDHVAGTG